MTNPTLRPASFEEIAAIHNRIPEFTPETPAFFAGRCENRKTLALAAFLNGEPAGYAVCYDRYEDGSLYCWMAGVLPDFRKNGVYSALAAAREAWAIENGFTALTIKTRNNRREMLRWLVNNNFDFIKVDKHDPLADSRIYLVKELHRQ